MAHNRRMAMIQVVAAMALFVLGCRPSTRASIVQDRTPPSIDHILLEVHELDRSIVFYRDHLGLTLKKRSGDFVTLEAANVGVYLWSKRWDWSSPPPEGGRSPQGMYPHFVIRDVKGTMERLRLAGYRIVAEAKDYSYGTEGFVADPDGFVWALISQ